MAVASGQRQVICECCSLLCPSDTLSSWVEQRPARRLKALGPIPGAHELHDEDPSSPYRGYTVEHRHRVCPICYAHLEAGGEFRAVTRHRGKMTFIAMVAVLALLLALGPFLLPHLLSALWLAEGESGR